MLKTVPTLLDGFDVNDNTQSLKDHHRIRPTRHDRPAKAAAAIQDVDSRVQQMNEELLEQFGLWSESGTLTGGIIPLVELDRLAVKYELAEDTSDFKPGSWEWRTARQSIPMIRASLRKKINCRARWHKNAFQLVIAEPGKSVRICPVPQFAGETPRRGMRKLYSAAVGFYQELHDLASRSDLPQEELAIVMMCQRMFENTALQIKLGQHQMERDVRKLSQPRLL